MILHPDLTGRTALDIAIENERPKCFELMLDMLEDFNGMCLSKMMLQSFPYMILSGSDLITKFFNTCTYQPATMTKNIRVPWPQHLKEVIFASHSALISEPMLIEEIDKNSGMYSKFYNTGSYQDELSKWLTADAEEDKKEKVEEDDDKFKQHKDESNSLGLVSKRDPRKDLRSQRLEEASHTKEKKASIKRIALEAVDFDWIFIGKNAVNLIHLLSAKNVQKRLLKQKSLRIFIKLLWDVYKKKIKLQRFYPFCLYLVVVNVMTCTGADLVGNFAHESSAEEDSWRTSIIIMSIFVQVYWVCNLYSEVQEMCRDGLVDYLADVWNYLDVSIAVLS